MNVNIRKEYADGMYMRNATGHHKEVLRISVAFQSNIRRKTEIAVNWTTLIQRTASWKLRDCCIFDFHKMWVNSPPSPQRCFQSARQVRLIVLLCVVRLTVVAGVLI